MKWKAEDVEFLLDKWGQSTIPTIANKLNRSINAVKLKAQKLRLDRHIHSGEYITLNQLAEALGVSYHLVTTHWFSKGLPIKYKKSVTIQNPPA